MNEILIQKSIVQWMNLVGHAVFLNEISGMPDLRNKSGRRKLRGNKNSSDIIGTLKGGRACFIEVKQPKFRKKVTEICNKYEKYGFCLQKSKMNKHIIGQVEFLAWQRSRGAFAMFAYYLEEVEEALKTLQGENK